MIMNVLCNHQLRKGSSEGLRVGGRVFESGYVPKFDTSPGFLHYNSTYFTMGL